MTVDATGPTAEVVKQGFAMSTQTIHGQEKEQFIKLFQQDQIRHFEDRLAILEVFLRCEHHVTAQELAELVFKQHHQLSLAFVEETMALMCRYGFAHAINFDEGQTRYEHRHLGQHHDHMICTKCQTIIEFENLAIEQLQQQIAETCGFHLLQHKMEMYGICRTCLAQRDRLITLDTARAGEKLTVKALDGGAKAKLRLLAMGLRVGDEIEVITNLHKGQVVVAVAYKRLVLGRGLAQKIQVTPAIVRPGEAKLGDVAG